MGIGTPVPLGLGLVWLSVGIFSWTFFEYSLHRFGFHYSAKTAGGKWIVYLFHGNHHEDPHDSTRLVMPPAVSIFVGAFIYLICRSVLTHGSSEYFFVGMVWGYLVYDYTHFAIHHFEPRTRMGKYLKRHHYLHHYDHLGSKWGVSTPLWDHVFGTYHSKKRGKDV
jgi:sterol desaturase/sphingolipid hydroxylase (fatty acid hydroxylase superfamily)